MIDVNSFTQYPICDTDIWVKICLGNIHHVLFNCYDKIIVADVVEGEILKWDKDGSKFKFIADNFIYYKKIGKILVIHHDIHIPEDDRRILEQQLYDLGFENDFNNKPPEDDKGEFVSAIYADYFGIPFMKSNDGSFSEGKRGHTAFPELVVKNWYVTTEELIADHKKRMQVRSLVESENKKMENEKNRFILKRETESKELLQLKLEQLQAKYSKRN